jgi:uncharacterized protein (DUF2249 family)
MTTLTATTVDVRSITPRDRHPVIFSTFWGLMPGQAMELVNDHDPVPLHRQFDAEMPARFDWDYLESGPTLWRVRITKRAGSHAAGSCCGACGGA